MFKFLNAENEIFNLGGGKDHSINDFAKYVCEGFEFDYNLIERDLSKYVGVKSKLLDIKKIAEYNMTSLDKGLKETIDWYIDQKNEQ